MHLLTMNGNLLTISLRQKMTDLKQIIKEEVSWYAGCGTGLNMKLFKLLDDVNQTYALMAVDDPPTKEPADVVVMARIVGDLVIIEQDNTDRPLVKHLQQAGIPREKIILAYAGEA